MINYSFKPGDLVLYKSSMGPIDKIKRLVTQGWSATLGDIRMNKTHLILTITENKALTQVS